MERTGERQIPDTPGTTQGIEESHLQRYQWASMFTRGKRVYDVACGTGYGSLLLEANQYIGFDISQEAIDYANQYYAMKRDTAFCWADACNMPAIDMADVIVSFETIEHLKAPDAFLSWCSGHAKMLVISSPIRHSSKKSHFHLFEYRLIQFEQAVRKYFPHVTLFVQTHEAGIIYPCRPESMGVAIGVCQKSRST